MNSERLKQRFIRYVKCGSESGNEKNIANLLKQELTDLGLQVFPDEVGLLSGSNGCNVIARLEGYGDSILFNAHMDTVNPGNKISPVLENGVFRSSGDTVLGADDKAGIAAVMEALERILESGCLHRTVEVLFTVCEEIGMLGAKYADYGKIKSRRAIVFDSDHSGEIINRNPANIVLHFRVKGKSAHAGLAPQDGIHALKAAAKAVAEIPVGNVDELSVMNISNFISKGKTNIVPDTAAFDMEIRSFEESRLQEHISASEKAVKDSCESYGANYEMFVERHSDVIHVPENSGLIKEIKSAYEALDVESQITSSFGGCDATYLFANGFEVVNLGIGMQDVHSCEEHIAVNDLETVTNLILMMMKGRQVK